LKDKEGLGQRSRRDRMERAGGKGHSSRGPAEGDEGILINCGRGGCLNALMGGLLGSPACFHARLPWPLPRGGGAGVDGTVPAALANLRLEPARWGRWGHWGHWGHWGWWVTGGSHATDKGGPRRPHPSPGAGAAADPMTARNRPLSSRRLSGTCRPPLADGPRLSLFGLAWTSTIRPGFLDRSSVDRPSGFLLARDHSAATRRSPERSMAWMDGCSAVALLPRRAWSHASRR